jgi:hypothetical protein
MTTDELLAWMESQPGADLCGPSITDEGMWRARRTCMSNVLAHASAPTIAEAIRKLKELVEQVKKP